MMVAAVAVIAISTVLFLLATDVPMPPVARFLFGLATGVLAATATAALSELAGCRGIRTCICDLHCRGEHGWAGTWSTDGRDPGAAGCGSDAPGVLDLLGVAGSGPACDHRGP